MNRLLIVDPQNDFVNPSGSLYVSGAEVAITNICKHINDTVPESIVVSLDWHRRLHVSNSAAWKEKPEPGTVITEKDILNGKYHPVLEDYAEEIKWNAVQPINIWPEHCIVNSWGAAIPEDLVKALSDWEEKTGNEVLYVTKGEEVTFEAYSMYTKGPCKGSFDVMDGIINSILHVGTCSDDSIIQVCGFCKDICVANTINDLMYYCDVSRIQPLDECMATLNPDAEILSLYDNWK